MGRRMMTVGHLEAALGELENGQVLHQLHELMKHLDRYQEIATQLGALPVRIPGQADQHSGMKPITIPG